jgi:hypothetical protein
MRNKRQEEEAMTPEIIQELREKLAAVEMRLATTERALAEMIPHLGEVCGERDAAKSELRTVKCILEKTIANGQAAYNEDRLREDEQGQMIVTLTQERDAAIGRADKAEAALRERGSTFVIEQRWAAVTDHLDAHIAGRGQYSDKSIAGMLGELNCLYVLNEQMNSNARDDWRIAIREYQAAIRATRSGK